MAQNNVWMVRAGNDNLLADLVKDKCAVAIGWDEMGDLSALHTRDDFKDWFAQTYPDVSASRVPIGAGQVYRFVREIRVGDYVLTYIKATREMLIGVVQSDYAYDPTLFSEEYPHLRYVEWQKSVSRDVFSPSARNSMGSVLTVFALTDYLDEVTTALVQRVEEPIVTPESEDEPPFFDDVKAKATSRIDDLISELDAYQFQGLVAAVLRAIGYQAMSSPKGRDRGVDVVAHTRPLGIEGPRIKVQVKHRKDKASAEEIRAFITTLRGYSGIFVSTGDFTSEAKAEVENAHVPISLFNRDAFIELMLEHYEALEPDFKELVPLERLWIPVVE